jgi:septal ring factor EnvC (AmiA/AmiB activator)
MLQQRGDNSFEIIDQHKKYIAELERKNKDLESSLGDTEHENKELNGVIGTLLKFNEDGLKNEIRSLNSQLNSSEQEKRTYC